MFDDEEGEDFITCVMHVCVGCIIRQNVCTHMYLVQKACSIYTWCSIFHIHVSAK